MINLVIKLIMCHMIGDYFLQSNFLATTKGKNWYHLFVHSVLYCVPFVIMFGIDWKLGVLLLSHILIDPLKARYNKITYVQDQVLHYIICLIYLF